MKRLFYIIITIGMFSGCILSDPNSSKLNSKDYESKLERIEILKKEEINNPNALYIDNFDPGRMQTEMQESQSSSFLRPV